MPRIPGDRGLGSSRWLSNLGGQDLSSCFLGEMEREWVGVRLEQRGASLQHYLIEGLYIQLSIETHEHISHRDTQHRFIYSTISGGLSSFLLFLFPSASLSHSPYLPLSPSFPLLCCLPMSHPLFLSLLCPLPLSPTHTNTQQLNFILRRKSPW